jgi:hypothetical protein
MLTDAGSPTVFAGAPDMLADAGAPAVLALGYADDKMGLLQYLY